ncbi:MAG: 4-hydroxythreonine-4-phosphate dehydrogenase PdxA [Proteobacteria bacterium]|nr:4-hydroxythreonine-4-phosphate dehydrogenase PdxA [Pseudomonadota bacterium]
MSNSKMEVVLTPGEPAGIGPDIVVQLLDRYRQLPVVLVADQGLIEQRANLLGVRLPEDIKILHVPLSHKSLPGILDSRNAGYVLACLEVAANACLQGKFHALVTGPVHKGIINQAGIPFTGHTEYLAQLTKSAHVVMLMACESLKVALLTTHLPLSEVPKAITQEKIYNTIQVIHKDLGHRFQYENPRIAVCGLNPHAGENGYLGREEIDIIAPVLKILKGAGLLVHGPLPADTAFTPQALEKCDVVLTLYHDQGLPVIKANYFQSTVNVTLGLPIIRTSVDHGTALDLAGTGKTCCLNLLAAIEMALQLKGN